MSLLRLIFVSFFHHWRMNLAVALGAAAGTAVLTGALLVGDSMRGSLRSLALDRLGNIDEVLAPGRFFREKLADELKETADYKQYGTSLVPAILLPASMENPATQTRANRVEVIGCNADFRNLFLPSPSGRGTGGEGREGKIPQADSNSPSPHPNPLPKGEGTANAREIDLNEPLAEKLGVKAGDDIILRLPTPGLIPSDSALGEKRDTVLSYRLTVRNILPAAGLGHFSLKPSQQEPLNAYVPLEWLQEQLEQAGKVNSLLLSLNEEGYQLSKIAFAGLQNNSGITIEYPSLWKRIEGIFSAPTTSNTARVSIQIDDSRHGLGLNFNDRHVDAEPIDYGIKIEDSPREYINITSDTMILGPNVESAVNKAKEFLLSYSKDITFQPVYTYLANTIADRQREIPYSTITAIDFTSNPPLGPFVSSDGKALSPLGKNEIALNTWAANDLNAKIGDMIAIKYFAPESTHGKIQEKTIELKLAAIIELTGAADDRHLTPTVKGITDELTMADWDPPFPFDAKRIRPQDDDYWNEHGPTPKAFVSLETGRDLWGSRFGKTTSIRLFIPAAFHNIFAPSSDIDTLRKFIRNRSRPTSFGFMWQPVKLQGLAAAQGTTPFNVLFLAFSFFIIVSALMLVLLLFKLGVERRAAEIGILLAVGWKPKQVRKLLFCEGVLTSLCGGAIGLPLGIGYAALMLWGLQTWWLAAIVTPFLKLYISTGSLTLGFFAGFLMGLITIYFAVRKISRIAPRQLLAGVTNKIEKGPHPQLHSQRKRKSLSWINVLWLIFLAGNIFVWLFARRLGNLEAGMFFGGGALMLILTLLVLWNRLRRGATGSAVAEGGGNLFRLALRNAARNPGRSTLTIGLMASACFLIVAVSAFQLDPSQQTPNRQSGNGGFALAAESSQPIFQNLNTPDGRAEIGFSEAEEKTLAACKIYSLRVRAGDDASCLNLYKPRSPRILGLPENFLARDGFAWADKPAKCKNPWELLSQTPTSEGTKEEESIPVILEKNTANYSLNLWGGLGEIYKFPESVDKNFPMQVAALLDNSIFQGDLLIAEDALLKKFPETSGYRFFLVECPAEKTADVQKILENRLGDYGFVAETTGQRLARFLAVQNTYLSTFQSLGGLGLLLGTLGLAAVQLRNVFERRGELALLRAVGFGRKQLARLVLMENAVLLILGLGSGILSALVAVMPHFLTTSAKLPWLSLAGTLALVLLVGMLAGLAAARQVLKAPLLSALREDR